MKLFTCTVVLLAIVGFVAAGGSYPAAQPNEQYLPPSQPQQQYLAPQQAPQQQYLPPSQPQQQYLPPQQAPQQQYLPPSQPQQQYIPPSSEYAESAPAHNLGNDGYRYKTARRYRFKSH